MRAYTRIDEFDLMSLIRILTDNGYKLEIHRVAGEKEYYNVFILGSTEEEE